MLKLQFTICFVKKKAATTATTKQAIQLIHLMIPEANFDLV